MVSRLIPIVILAVASTSFSRPDAVAEARKDIQEQYDRINAAVRKKDVKILATFYAPVYEFVSVRGEKITLRELEKGLTPVLARATGIHGKTVVRSVRLNGSKAVVQIQ